VDLEPVLRAISLSSKKLFGESGIAPVFSEEQARLLATYIPIGLGRATAQQDILFVLQRPARTLGILSNNALTSGRVFYTDGKLNIIIGEHDRGRNYEFERHFETSDTVNPYDLSPGSRKRPSGAIKGDIVPLAGLSSNEVKGKPRPDWFVIDVPEAIASLQAQPAPTAVPAAQTAAAPPAQTTGGAPAAGAAAVGAAAGATRTVTPMPPGRTPGTNIEERLRLLIKLYEEGLIDEADFEAKKLEILSEL
jgi:hypothetical protein